jgi:hypothetical protein
VADRAPEGAEHIKESLVGAILWVSWPTIGKTALIYAAVGALHIVYRNRFFQISFRPQEAFKEGRMVRLWDFLFYLTFAFVITSSVAIAGVLLVFSFLVIPAVIASLFAERIGTRLAIGWTTGIAACLIGLAGSYRMDMPSGPAVVAALGGALILAGLVYYIRTAPEKRYAFLKVLAALTIVAVVCAAILVTTRRTRIMEIEHSHAWEMENGGSGHEPRPAPELEDPDPLQKLEIAVTLTRAGSPQGLALALTLLGRETPLLIRDDAYRLVLESTGREFGYDPFAETAENDAALAEMVRELATFEFPKEQ